MYASLSPSLKTIDIIRKIKSSLTKIHQAEASSQQPIGIAIQTDLKMAMVNVRELLKENSLYPLSESQDILEFVECLHDLTAWQLKHLVLESDDPLHVQPAAEVTEFYFSFLQKTVLVKAPQQGEIRKLLLSQLDREAQADFYRKAGQLFFNTHYYHEAAWYWGVAYRLHPTAAMAENLAQLETEVYQHCCRSLFKSNALTQQTQAILLQLHELALVKEDVKNNILEFLKQSQINLQQLHEQGKTRQMIDLCSALSDCVDTIVEKQPALIKILEPHKRSFIELMNQDYQAVLNYNWKNHLQLFKAAQENLLQTLDNKTSLKTSLADYNQAIIDLLKTCLAAAFQALGNPPGKGIAVMAIGSLSRGDFSLHSDIDLALVIDQECDPTHSYFQHLIHYLQISLALLGQPWRMDNNGRTLCRVVEGMHIDSDILNVSCGLIQSPNALAKWSVEQGFQGLYRPLLMYATENCNLYEDYQHEVATQLGLNLSVTDLSMPRRYQTIALKDMQRHAEDWQKALSTWKDIASFNLKTHVLAPLTNWMLDMALYCNLTTSEGHLLRDIPSIIKALETDITFILQQTLEQLQQLRLQWQAPRQTDFTLTEQQYHQLQTIHEWLIKPLWQSSDSLLQQPETRAWNPLRANLQRALNHYRGFVLLEFSLEEITRLKKCIEGKVGKDDNLDEKIIQKIQAISSTNNDWTEVEFELSEQKRLEQFLVKKQEKDLSMKLLHYKNLVEPTDNNNLSTRFDISTLEALLRLFLQSSAPLASFVDVYRQVPDEFRQEYTGIVERLVQQKGFLISKKITVKENFLTDLLARLNIIANKDGWRPLSAQKKQGWEKALYRQLSMQDEDKTDQLITLTWAHGKTVIQCFLSPAIAAQLFSKEGNINEANRVKVEGTSMGRRTVIPVYDQQKKIIAYAKFYPEFSGIQEFVNDLSQRLEGSSAQATLVQVQHPKAKHAYPILFSQPLQSTLFDELRSKGSLNQVENDLDDYFYTLAFLKDLALLLEDNKEDNIGITTELNPKGELGKRLISFDSDHALVEPLIERKTLLGKEEKVQAKSIVFCFKKQMQGNLDTQAIADFLNFNIKALLQKTAESLQQRDSYYVGAEGKNTPPIFPQFADYVDEAKKDTFCCIPTVFEIGSISHLYQRLLRMQSALQLMQDSNQSMTHLDFFKLIEPALAAHYEKALNQADLPEVIFRNLPTEYIEKAIAKSNIVLKQSVHGSKQRLVNSLTIVDELKRKTLHDLIKEKKYHTPWHMEKELNLIDQRYEVKYVQRVIAQLYQGNVQPFIDLGQYAYYIKEQVIAKLEWNKIELDVQVKILKAMQNTRFTYLNLAHCIALTDEVLQLLLVQGSYLQRIDISGCEQLTNLNPLSHCPQLRVLLADRLPRLIALDSIFYKILYSQLKYLSLKEGFPQLKYLSLKAGALQTLKIQAPLLQELIISGCKDLQSLSLHAPELQLVEARNCFKLSNILQLDAPKLLSADFSYCQNLRLANVPTTYLTETKLQMQGCDREFADYFYNRGNAKSNLKDYTGALVDYDQAIALDPKEAAYFNNRGNAKSNLKDYAGALADYDEAIVLNPKEAEYFIRRCIVKFHLKDYAGAITDFDQAIALDPTEAIYFNGRGEAKSNLKDYAGALVDYDQAIALNPTDAAYFNNRGNAKYDLKNYAGALADYDQAIALNPKEADYFNNRGYAKSHLKDYAGALADFDQAIALNPKVATYFNNRGDAKYDLKNYAGALADYDQAIALNPKEATYFNNRGNAKSDLKDYTGALADFDQAIALNSTEAAYFNYRGNAKSDLKDYTGAIADFDQAIAFDPKEAVYFYNRGNAKSNLKDYTGAIADYDEAIALNPTDADYFNYRGSAKYDLKDFVGALADYDEAIALNPNEAVYFNDRGTAKYLLKDNAGAIADMHQAISSDAHYARAYFKLGFFKQQQAMLLEAVDDYCHAVKLNDSGAMLLLGLLYERGLVIALMPDEARALLEKAAQKDNYNNTALLQQQKEWAMAGNKEAQILLGAVYQYGGLNEPKDLAQARYYFELAAKQGDKYAQQKWQVLLDSEKLSTIKDIKTTEPATLLGRNSNTFFNSDNNSYISQKETTKETTLINNVNITNEKKASQNSNPLNSIPISHVVAEEEQKPQDPNATDYAKKFGHQ